MGDYSVHIIQVCGQLEPRRHNCSSTWYPSLLGRQRQYGLGMLPDTSIYDQQWESNPRPFDLESDALGTHKATNNIIL